MHLFEDTDQLKFPEYVAGFLSIPTSVTDKDIIPAFQVFDSDKTGFIQAEEMLKNLANVGEQLNEIEAKTFKDNMNINEEGLFNYNGKERSSLFFEFILFSIEFYLKFTEPPKPKKKKGKKKKKKK
jgi:Ca2+-binding EF-hand superfamily protein